MHLLQALTVGYIACCVVSGTLELIKTKKALDDEEKSKYSHHLREIASQLQNTIREIENQLNEKDSDDEDIELNRILLLQLLGFLCI